MALLGNISSPTLISSPYPKIHVSTLVGTRKTTIKNNKSWPLACEANYNTTNKFQLHHLNGDFSKLQFPVEDFINDYERKLEDVRHSLMESRKNVEDPIGSFLLVDAIQHLGMGHHYDEEIHAILKQHHVETSDRIYGFRSLHDVSLSFRLLRQRGYNVSADVFNNFKGEDGKFKEELKQDTKGLMQLYEATQLSFEGENILDEAEVFSKQHLYQHLAANNSNNMDDDKWSTIVRTRLRHPVHKSVTRMTGMNNFLSHDLIGDINIGLLGELVNMDIIIGRAIYHQELQQVSKWRDDLGLTKELVLARNQPIIWYSCSIGMLNYDINLSAQRVHLSKSISFIYLINDIFDHYGTPEDLTIFTQAVDKWDYASMDMLPDYMKACYKALLDTINEIGRSICEKYGYNPISVLKQTWKELCTSFLVEAKWFASGDFPRTEDYLANGKVSSGVHVVLAHLFCILGLDSDNEGAIHLDDTSTLISCVSGILRLWNDFGSGKDEHQNGNDGSYVECFLRDHNHDVRRDQLREHMINMIATEWKRLNKECFNLKHSSFKEASLNLARMAPFLYDYDDNQRLAILEEFANLGTSPTSFDHHHTEK